MAGAFDLELIFQKDSKDNIVGYYDLDYVELIDGGKSIETYVLSLQANQFLTF